MVTIHRKITAEKTPISISDLVETTEENIRGFGVKTLEDVRKAPQKCVRLSTKVDKQNKELKAFLFQNFYKHYRVERMAAKAVFTPSGALSSGWICGSVRKTNEKILNHICLGKRQ